MKLDIERFAEIIDCERGQTIVDIAEKLEAAGYWTGTRYEYADERTILSVVGRILRTAKMKNGLRRFGCYPAKHGR